MSHLLLLLHRDFKLSLAVVFWGNFGDRFELAIYDNSLGIVDLCHTSHQLVRIITNQGTVVKL